MAETMSTYKIDAFPNPFNENIYFREAQKIRFSKGSIIVINIKGDLILKMDLTNAQDSPLIGLNTDAWPPGTYCYRIVLDTFIQSGKMIKIL
jgi:hypothetical protein